MVSVIIPTYNRAYCIEKSIRSVLDQTYRDFELIIIDDGSTDNTREVISRICDDRIIYIYQKNAGACAARNRGIEEARGEYIAFHDSDDTWRMDKLKKQIDVCNEYDPDIQFCKIAKHKSDGTVSIIPKSFEGGFCANLTNLFGIGIATVLLKRSVLKDARFDLDMPKWQDFELLLRITPNHRLYCLDEVLYDYYIQNDNISNKTSCKAAELLLKKHPSFSTKYPKMSETISNILIHEANTFYSMNKTEAMNCLKVSKKYNNSQRYLIKRMMVKYRLFGIVNHFSK